MARTKQTARKAQAARHNLEWKRKRRIQTSGHIMSPMTVIELSDNVGFAKCAFNGCIVRVFYAKNYDKTAPLHVLAECKGYKESEHICCDLHRERFTCECSTDVPINYN